MAREFSRLEKALAALVGLDIARPGTNRAAAKAAVGALARGGRVLVPAAARTTTSLATSRHCRGKRQN
jgi:polygalacturonase